MMEQILLQLIETLQCIGGEHPELYDSEVRQRMGGAIMDAFVRSRQDCKVPDDFGMYTGHANHRVKTAIESYITAANKRAAELGMIRFYDRLEAFQNPKVQTSVPGNDYEEFFGHTPLEFYDESGTVVRTN